MNRQQNAYASRPKILACQKGKKECKRQKEKFSHDQLLDYQKDSQLYGHQQEALDSKGFTIQNPLANNYQIEK